MICAYDKLYVENACTALGRMLDFAVYELQYDLSAFFALFINSGVAKRFGQGDFTLLVGKSGVELAYEVLELAGVPHQRIPARFVVERSPEYWTGWALAYYQWKTALSFKEIVQCVPIAEICAMYSPYHEMNIQQYEQRQKNINKAQVEYLVMLAQAMCCNIENLIEKVV